MYTDLGNRTQHSNAFTPLADFMQTANGIFDQVFKVTSFEGCFFFSDSFHFVFLVDVPTVQKEVSYEI